MMRPRVGDTTAGFSIEAQKHRFSGTPTHQINAMQRVLLPLCLAAASAFVAPQSTAYSLGKLQANPIDIYSTAAARNYDSASSWERQQLDDVALPIF